MRKIGEWLLWATDFLQATLSTPSSTCCIIWGAQCKMKMRDKCLKKNQEFQDSNSNGCRPWGQHVGQCFLPSSSLRRSVAMCRIHPASWLPSSLTSFTPTRFPCPLHVVHLCNLWDLDLKASHTDPQDPAWLQSPSFAFSGALPSETSVPSTLLYFPYYEFPTLSCPFFCP